MSKPTPVKSVVYEFVFCAKNALKGKFEACLNRIYPFSAFFSGAFRKTFVLTGLLVMSLTTVIQLHSPATAAAANPTLNFQARLETGSGGIAPDAIYNLQFNLYEGGTASGGGTKVWTENRLVSASEGIRVHNGYLTANLGEVTSFPGTINWDADLYLTLDIGDTSSCTITTDFDTDCGGDGEMTPRLKLTAVPYAFQAQRAEQLSQAQTNFNGSLQFQTLTGGDQTFELQDQGAAGTYTLLTTNQADTNYIQNQNSSAQATSNFWISGTGIASTLQAATIDTPSGTTTLSLGNANATTLNIGTTAIARTINIGTGAADQDITIGSLTSGSTLTFQSDVDGVVFNSPAGGTGGRYNFQIGGTNVLEVDHAGRVRIQSLSNGGNAFRVQNSIGNNVLEVDTNTSLVNVAGLVAGAGVSNTVTIQGGTITFDTAGTTNYVTPLGSNIGTKINIPNQDPGSYGQLIALGLPSTAASTARAITLLDARATAHQPTLALLSPDENQIGGFSYDGSNTTLYVKNSANNIVLQSGDVNVLLAQKSGTDAIVTIGEPNVNQGKLVLATSANTNTVILQSATQTSGSYTLTIPNLTGNDTICTVTTGCGGAGATDLQGAYNGGNTIVLASNNAVQIQDNSTPITGNLFEVTDNGGTTNYFSVADSQVTIGDASNETATTLNGSVLVKPVTDSTNTFRIQNAAGDTQLNFSTLTGTLSVGDLTFAPAGAAESLWNEGSISGTYYDEVNPRTVGVVFRPNVNGQVTGVKFYNPSGGNSGFVGDDTGKLWACNDSACDLASGGSVLASVTFPNDTSEGWQSAEFGSPVSVTAGTYYIVTHYSTNGTYYADNSYFTTSYTSSTGNLYAPDDATIPNGVYESTNSDAFPDANGAQPNYWTDVMFVPTTSGDNITTTNSLNISSGGQLTVGTLTSATVVQGSTVDIDAASTLNVGNTTATTVNIANNNANHTVNIATGTGDQTVTVGSTDGASSTTLQAGTGALSLLTGNTTGNSGAIYIKSGDSSSGVAGNITIDNGASAAGTPSNILNDDFEGCSADDMSVWYGLASANGSNIGASAHGGSCVLAATESGSNWAIGQDYMAVSATAGEQVTVSAWVRAASLSEEIWGNIVWNGGNPDTPIPSVTTTTTGWTKMTITTVVPTGATAFHLTFGSGDGNGSAVTYFDDITIVTDQGTPAINIGTGNAESINIGHTGAEVNLQGNVSATGTLTASGGDINLNANSNYAVNIATGTSTGAVTIGNSANTTTLGSDTIIIGSATVASLIQGASQTTSNTDGASLTLQGSAGNGTGNGGTLVLSGGAAGGSGGSVKGLVSISPASFASLSAQSLGTSQTLTQSWVDDYSTIPIVATTDSLTFTVPTPTISTLGRVLYISNAGSTNDFSLTLGGTSITLTLKTNSSATLIWNGNGWTAAGASSSTDLQSAYNNTLTSAGGAELILNAPGGNADGLTIRNNPTTPITGGILEVQSSIGTNLFSVNNLGTELAANGGVEDTDTFSTDWTAYGSGTTIAQSNTSGQFATGRYGVRVSTSGAGVKGVTNNLSGNPVASSVVYTVSFTGKVSSGTPAVTVFYEPDGSTPTYCTNYGTYTTLSTSAWTKITCTITTPATAVTDPNLVITTNDGATRDIYIDNLSFIRNDTSTQPSNVQIGGGLTGGQVTLFTLDRSSSAPLADSNDPTFLGSMYYDTTLGNIQCYEADGWGACGSAPDNIVTLTPEYSNAVLAAPGTMNGTSTATGVGTLTADFCSNESGVLQVNTSFCANHISRNYYRWTSPQPTAQTYSIYVNYKLPSTFKNFYDDSTIKLSGYRDSATDTNANLKLSVFRSNGSTITQCGSTTQITSSSSTWETTSLGGSGETTCGFQAGEYVVFKIDVTASNNYNTYVENLEFRYTNQ